MGYWRQYREVREVKIPENTAFFEVEPCLYLIGIDTLNPCREQLLALYLQTLDGRLEQAGHDPSELRVHGQMDEIQDPQHLFGYSGIPGGGLNGVPGEGFSPQHLVGEVAEVATHVVHAVRQDADLQQRRGIYRRYICLRS